MKYCIMLVVLICSCATPTESFDAAKKLERLGFEVKRTSDSTGIKSIKGDYKKLKSLDLFKEIGLVRYFRLENIDAKGLEYLSNCRELRKLELINPNVNSLKPLRKNNLSEFSIKVNHPELKSRDFDLDIFPNLNKLRSLTVSGLANWSFPKGDVPSVVKSGSWSHL